MARLNEDKDYGVTQADLCKPGTFKNVGSNVHVRQVGPADGTLAHEVHVHPGEAFECEGNEAAMCRGSNKFLELI